MVEKLKTKKIRFKFAKQIGLAILFLATISSFVWLGIYWGLSRSDWAAWVQAVGSVLAILVAVWIANIQHLREVNLQAESQRLSKRNSINLLRWTFINVAEACKNVASMIHDEHVYWPLQSEVLEEQRRQILSVSLEYLDPAVLIRTQEVAHSLHMAMTVVEALDEPRSKNTKELVAKMLLSTQESALVGFTETSRLLKLCSNVDEIKADMALLNAREENRKLTLEVLDKLKKQEHRNEANDA